MKRAGAVLVRSRHLRGIAVGIGTVAVFAVADIAYLAHRRPLTELTGVVLRQDKDPTKQPPIANAEVSLADGLSQGSARSDATGLFHLKLRPGVRAGEGATLILHHADFQTATIFEILHDRLYVIRLAPAPTRNINPQIVTDVKIRYSLRNAIIEDVGSEAKRFEVINRGDVPCERGSPCSPDRKWKAAIGGVTLDAPEGSEFHNARVTCVSGPCPFTKIEKDGFSKGGRRINVAVRNWSDTTSFVLEADVTSTVNSESTRQTFPITMNQVLSFTLPALAQGPSIEATIGGKDIVYPLGPALKLSWADCGVTTTKDQIKVFRCELRPGYRFR